MSGHAGSDPSPPTTRSPVAGASHVARRTSHVEMISNPTVVSN